MATVNKYSTEELQAAYSAGAGLAGVCAKFGMSIEAARIICTRRGIHIPHEYIRQKSTAFLDAAIRAAYESGESRQVHAVAEKYRVKLGWVKWRALQLGCRTGILRKEPAWNDREIELLEEYQGYTLPTIQRKLKAAGFCRTLGAIHHRQCLLGLSGAREEGYSASEVARLLGLPHVHAVLRWIDSGLLPAHRARYALPPSSDPKKDPVFWFVTPAALRRFIIENAGLVDFRKLNPNRQWFVSLLTDVDLSRSNSPPKKSHPAKSKEAVK